MSRTIHPVMVGTAGHIDHGKSSLVRALTGVDPDRLKEEKERGLTIDLGFAPMEMEDGRILGMVDVPGHERFVRNMVAGSSGLDLAILVVAADDSVMPQTREHLHILHLLGVQAGIVAMTKIDMVDAEMRELAEEEIRELLQGTCLASAEIIPLSSTTGAGIPEFRQKLEAMAREVPPRSSDGPFRMPIQRVFTLKGIGTVITGIPSSGSIDAGDTVEILPIQKQSKVRAVQAYGDQVTRAVAGHSTALSVPDIKAHQLRRGCVAAAPGVFRIGDTVDIHLEMLPDAETLVHRTPIRFHVGTIECRGRLVLLDRDKARPGEKFNARVILEEPVCGVYGDRFLMRLQNPVVTVGGGEILRLAESAGRYRRKNIGEELSRLVDAGSDATSRVLEELKRAGPEGRTPGELAGGLGIQREEIDAATAELGDEIHVHERAGRIFVSDVIEDGKALIERSVDRLLKDKALAASIKRSALQTSKSLPQVLVHAVLAKMQEEGHVESSAHGRLLFRDRLKPLEAEDQKQLDRLTAACDESAFRPLTEADLSAATGVKGAKFAGLLARAVDTGLVEHVGEHVYSAAIVRKALVAIYENCTRNDGELQIPALRDVLGTSRKFLIPLLEYVDGLGMTQLRGGVRRLLTTSPVCQQIADASGVSE